MLCPSGTLEDRTSDREPTGTYSRRSRKGITQTRVPGWREQPRLFRIVRRRCGVLIAGGVGGFLFFLGRVRLFRLDAIVVEGLVGLFGLGLHFLDPR